MKKHLTPFRVVAGLLVLLVFTFGGVVAAGWLLPPPAIVVSEETTYITEPLRPDGLVDYREAYRRMYFADLTPENNAIFDYAQVVNPRRAWTEKDRRAFMDALDLTEVEAETFITLEDFAENHPDLVEATLRAQGLPLVVTDGLYDEKENTQRRNDELLYTWEPLLEKIPWRREEYPLVAAWLDAQAGLLQHIERGSRKPGFVVPATDRKKLPFDFLDLGIAETAFSRTPVERLCSRAMLHAGSGDEEAAWNDLVTAYRLAHHFGRQRIALKWLIGQSMRDRTMEGIASFAHHAPPSAEQLTRVRKQFDALPDFPGDDGVFDGGERLTLLDLLQMRPNDDISLLLDEEVSTRSVDWNVVMVRINLEIDRLANTQQRLDFQQRAAELRRGFKRLQEQRGSFESWHGKAALLLSRDARSEKVAYQLMDGISGVSESHLRAETRSDLIHQFTHLAIILAQYQAVHGEYPETLDALVPEFLTKLPEDPFAADGRIGYQRCDDGGYHLYSPGFNGVDDGGSSPDYHVDYSEIDDDIVLRVPVQEPPEEEFE